MKQLLYLAACIISLSASAQTYPFSEGFQGTTSGQVPAGWQGDIKVLSYHGQFDEKGLAAEIGGGDLVDSIISPLIGPTTASTVISFYYRIIDKDIYPSTPTNLDAGDLFELKVSSDGVNYTTVQQIDENNHNPNFNFLRKKVYIPQYAGSNINLKFVCSFGAGSTYFIDIDSVKVENDPTASISNVSDVKVAIFPNPCSQAATCNVQISNSEAYTLSVFDILGNNIYSIQGAGNTNLPAANFSRGLYLVQLKQNGRTFTQKLVIQ